MHVTRCVVTTEVYHIRWQMLICPYLMTDAYLTSLSLRLAVPVRVTCPDTLAGVIPGGTAGVVAEWNGGAAVRGAPARNARYGRLRLSADVWSSSAFWYVLMFGSLACGVAMQPGELFMSESAVWINDCVPPWPAASGLYMAIISS